MKTVVSGIRPTGMLHLGNYFGALKNFVKMQDSFKCFFFIADVHSLTTHPTPNNLQQSVKHVLAEYLALGLDPEKSTIFIQSDLLEVYELYTYMNMNAYLGELERNTTFKEKIRNQPDNINAGLLTYPVLMAVDILIHKADLVPVGKDQEQHLEMTRQFGNRFNRLYENDFFPAPKAFNFGEDLVKVPGLTGQGKMSKSSGEADTIFIFDDPLVLKKKIMRAKTDGGPDKPNQKMSPEIANLFDLMNLVSEKSTVEKFREDYNKMTIRYGDFKKQLAEDMEKFVYPLRTQISDMLGNTDYLAKVAEIGKEKAKASAQKTIKEVREIIGIKSFN